jgi:hypothetical protein
MTACSWAVPVEVLFINYPDELAPALELLLPRL